MAERILIVDDEVDMVSLLAFNLGRAGFSIITARDGGEALEKARMFLPDAIVLDVQIPELDGLSVCRMLRNQPSTRRIPVLIITGRGDAETFNASRRCGATDYLSKPFSPRDLISRVRAALCSSFAE